MSTNVRILLVEVVTALLILTFCFCLSQGHKPVEGSTPLCEMDGRFQPDVQAAWDFWMGPYNYFPCNQLPLEVNV